MESWLREDLDGSFDQEARRALAIYTELATMAVEHKLPMKLDY